MKLKWSKAKSLAIIMVLVVSVALMHSHSNRTERGAETDGLTLLNTVFDTLTKGKEVIIALEQEAAFHSYGTTLDEYWAIRMPTSENFNWREIAREDGRAAMSSGNRDAYYRISLSGKEDGKSWSFMVQSGSNYARLTYDNQEYYFAGAQEYAYDSNWTAAISLRSLYDTCEYKMIGIMYEGDSDVIVPNVGQDYLAAALTGYQQKEEVHLHVSKGSKFGFSFVKCDVKPAEDKTEQFRKKWPNSENTWAVYANTIFVPENEFAYHEAMAGNTEEYSGDDTDVPAGAFIYGRVGYVTLTADGWIVCINGTGW